MADRGAFGIEDARQLLTTRFGAGVAGVEELGGGAWSQAFAFRLGSRARILRISALEEDFRKDERAASYASPALPVPPVVEVGRTDGGWYAVSERRHGDFLEALDEAGMRRVLPSLLVTLDAIREADVQRTAGFGTWTSSGDAPFASWADYLLAVAVDRPGRREHGWRPQLEASDVGPEPFETAYAALSSLVGDLPDARHLVHSDLLNRNVLVTDGRITAVFDWGSSIYGDFLYDVAWLLFFAPWYGSWAGVDIEAAVRAHYADIGLDVPGLKQRLRACGLHIGLSGQAYTAFRGFWRELRWLADRTLAVAGQT